MHPYMRRIQLKVCSCGSGQTRSAEFDAKGIFLCFVCDSCRAEKLKAYRPEVLYDPKYETTEPVDDEDGNVFDGYDS